jgi:hypothetical protein
MGLSNLSFSATNINAGNDADKPVNPKPGDLYIATDTNIMYKCNVVGAWVTIVNALVAMSNSGSYYGNSTSNRAIPHGLGKTPKMVRIFSNDMGGGEGTIFEDIGIIRSMYDVSTNTYAVTKMDDTNFYVGNSSSYPASYNNTGCTYVWLAIL